MEKRVLGRGLEALIPSGADTVREKVQMIPVMQIHASRFQPRLNFSPEKINELARSIKEKGVIQPVIVRTVGVDQYELIAGERRLRAVKSLGISELPAIVRRVADADVLEMSIIENIQREELNVLEEAKAYKRLANEFGLSQDDIAQRVGKDKSSVSNLLRLLNLPDKIQDYLSKNFISFGHAKAILSLGDTRKQMSLCDKIIKKGLSVRQAEHFSTQSKGNRIPKVGTHNADIQSLEETLSNFFGTKVKIHHGKKRGKVEIEYFSIEDLERILGLIGAK